MVARIRHRPEVGEIVREELWNRDRGETRREEEQPAERDGEPDEIRDVVPLEERSDDRPRIREHRADDALRRAADLVVEAVEVAVVARERRDDDVHGDDRPGDAEAGDRTTCPRLPSRKRVPDPECRDRKAHQLAGRHRQDGADRERARAGPCRGTRRRREGAGSRTSPGGSPPPRSSRSTGRRGRRAQAAPAARSEPRCRRPSQKTGKRAERDDDDLDDASVSGDGQTIQNGASSGEERIDVAAEPDHLLAGRAVRDLERSPVGRAPDGLHHVPEVEARRAGSPGRRRARSRRARSSSRASPPRRRVPTRAPERMSNAAEVGRTLGTVRAAELTS